MTLPRFSRALAAIGALCGASFVGIAAYAAHALTAPVRAMDQALLLHAAHVPAILVAAIMARPLANAAGGAFVLGTVLFCGSIYAHHLLALPVQGAAPAGGMALIVGWVLLATASVRASGPQPHP